MLTSHAQLGLSVTIITFVIGLPANVLAFYTFSRKLQRKPVPIDILLLNLTISDLIFLIFLPFKMKEAADNMVWNMPQVLCPLTAFVFYSTIYNSAFFLTAVSVERYLGVAFPIRYKLHRRPLYAVLVSAFFWILSSLNLSIVCIMPYYNPTGDGTHGNGTHGNDTHGNDTHGNGTHGNGTHGNAPAGCYSDFSPEQLRVLLPFRLELCLLLFCVPFLVSCFCYINFIRILSRHPRIGRRRRLRAIGLALGTLAVFALCFGPYNMSHLAGFIAGASLEWRHVTLQFSTFNACLDPLIFYFSSSAVRNAFNRCLTSLQRKLQLLRCPPMAPSGTDIYKDPSPNAGD
ncbi:free fatty acid receptor 2-like [Conger conger]|uniref:free fatty acid receptor 2-like n=1 Tax=Conger conger TaxID=82655 RepID=UPI002A5A7E7A|nr:free fatty acid receptor 2-like [Conger conger]